MLLLKIAQILVVGICLFSATTNAKTLKANQCTLALLPFGLTMSFEAQKEEILKAYKARGFIPSTVSSLESASEFEFYSDASVDCTPTYFGTSATTTVRLVESAKNKILVRSQTPVVVELLSCKLELLKAIAELPECVVR